MTRLACAALALLVASAACNVESPPAGPERVCTRACSATARQCSDTSCARGCNLVLDRLLEHEGGNVIACVARAVDRCDDHTWAACAARVGPHADGGPPAPPPPRDEDEELE